MRLIISCLLLLAAFLLVPLANAETSGTINASAYNFSAPIVGLFGYTVDNCAVDASCLGYKCYVDFDDEVDDSDTSKPPGTCMPPSTTQCFNDNRWFAPSTNVKNSNVTYYTCLSNETGKWSGLKTCASGEIFGYDSTNAGNCSASSSSSSSSGGGGGSSSNTTAAKKSGIAITSAIPDIQMVQGDSAAFGVSFKNTGNTTLSATKLSVSGIESSWVSVTPESIAILSPGNVNAFIVNISLPPGATINSYSTQLKLSAQDGTNDTKSFTLKVLPAPAAQADINQSYQSYSYIIGILEKNITGLQGANKEDVESLKTTVMLVKSKLADAKSDIEKGDYYNAKLILDDVAGLIDSANRQLAKVRPAESASPQQIDITLIAIIIAIVVGVVAFLAYLLWPTKESSMLAKGFGKK